MSLAAPFPWFGGKSLAAHLIWERFGNVPNYVEPFAGSLAVLLGRPHQPGIETVNDKDCYLANFWRALQADPEAVAFHADWPVNEADLHARHLWLMNREEFRERMKSDPDYFDAKIAGWWVWGVSSWIGRGWCDAGVYRQIPQLGHAGQGVHRSSRPHLGRGEAVHRQAPLYAYFQDLAARLRRVRVCCGDWTRVLGPSPTSKLGITGVLLDPPYGEAAGRDDRIYSEDDLGIAPQVSAWAVANGNNPDLRIALCGYEGEHKLPDSWECVSWKAHGGFGLQGNGTGRANAARERIWFSPHCLRQPLFEGFELLEGVPA